MNPERQWVFLLVASALPVRGCLRATWHSENGADLIMMDLRWPGAVGDQLYLLYPNRRQACL